MKDSYGMAVKTLPKFCSSSLRRRFSWDAARFIHSGEADLRAALYSAEGEALSACARQAESIGLRVVTMIHEGLPDIGLAGARLKSLIDRMIAGEFEIIVAQVGENLITIGAPVAVREVGND